MTKEEFLPTLSEKGQNIVKENIKNFYNKSFQVFYSDVSKVISQKDSDYIIYVKNDIPEDIEYRFLHEFFHCVQYEIGFPNLISTNFQYKEVATSISSMILDLDVRERLENSGYFQDLKYIKKSVKSAIKLLKIIQQLNDKEEITNLDDIIGLAGIMLTSDIANIKNNELLVLVKKVRPKVIKYYKTISCAVKLYSYTDTESVNNIFIYLLEKFEMSDFIKIQTHFSN